MHFTMDASHDELYAKTECYSMATEVKQRC